MNNSIGADLHILIIDDQKSMRSIIRQLLSQSGITKVSEASDGEEALGLLAGAEAIEPPDVIICDLHMEGMDGLDFVHHLRHRKNLTPVLILTGDSSKLLHEVTTQVGATKVLMKPISAPDLMTEIKQAIGFSD